MFFALKLRQTEHFLQFNSNLLNDLNKMLFHFNVITDPVVE